MKNVVLLSGGLDSTTALAMACQEEGELPLAVSFRYGSRHQDAEINAARKVAKYYDVKHDVMTVPDVYRNSESALFGTALMPEEEYETEGPSPTVVPFRNGLFISLATILADAHGAERVWISNHASDYNHWAYPDCSPEFVGAMANAMYVATQGAIRLHYPFLWMCKGEIIELACALNVPVELTWSCYKGGVKHCGVCPT